MTDYTVLTRNNDSIGTRYEYLEFTLLEFKLSTCLTTNYLS